MLILGGIYSDTFTLRRGGEKAGCVIRSRAPQCSSISELLIHSAQGLLINHAGKRLLISWPPPHLPPPTPGLPVPHNCITVGNFKLVASIHTAISICFSVVSSTKRASQPAPTKQAIPQWRPIVAAGTAGAR